MKQVLNAVSASWKRDESIGFKIVLNKQDFPSEFDFEGMISFLIKEQEKKFHQTSLQLYMNDAIKTILLLVVNLKQEKVTKRNLIELFLTAITELHILGKYGYIPIDDYNGIKYISDNGNFDPLTYDSPQWSEYIQTN